MDKIQEEFDKSGLLIDEDGCPYEGKFISNEKMHILAHSIYRAGYKAADLLPTEKVCPECGGKGTTPRYNLDTDSFHDLPCPLKNCHKGTIQLYYTPEQYKEIMDKDYPDDVLVWIAPSLSLSKWVETVYKNRHGYYYNQKAAIVIVQTAQTAPPADYRPEE